MLILAINEEVCIPEWIELNHDLLAWMAPPGASQDARDAVILITTKNHLHLKDLTLELHLQLTLVVTIIFTMILSTEVPPHPEVTDHAANA